MENLPTELQWRIFSYAGTHSILSARRVCRSWRWAATGHPSFWSNVFIPSAHASALSQASTRIRAAGDHPFSLDILLGQEPRLSSLERFARLLPFAGSPSQPAGTTALSGMVAASLPQLRHLGLSALSAPPDELHIFFPTLLGPAPLLQSFEFAAPGTSLQDNITIPLDIFAHHAPSLRSVELDEQYTPVLLLLLLPPTTPANRGVREGGASEIAL